MTQPTAAELQQIVKATGQTPTVNAKGVLALPDGTEILPSLGGWTARPPDGQGGFSDHGTILTGSNAGKPSTYGWASFGDALKTGGPILAGVLSGGALLGGALGGGAATAGADAAASGGADAGDAAFAADGLAGGGATAGTIPLATSATGAGAGAADATAASAGSGVFSHLILPGLISTGTAIGKALIQSNATSNAVKAETTAAQPYAIGGNAAWQQQLAKYGITLPASVTGGVGPNGMPSAPAPAATAAPASAPALSTSPNLPANFYTLASLAGQPQPPQRPATTSSFGGS